MHDLLICNLDGKVNVIFTISFLLFFLFLLLTQFSYGNYVLLYLLEDLYAVIISC
jgi:hypothetical protein